MTNTASQQVLEELTGPDNSEPWDRFRADLIGRVSNFNTSSGLALA